MRVFLSSTEVADELGVVVETVRAMIERGDLPAFKIGPRNIIKVARRDLDAYLERSRVKVGEAS